jgi:hypothetical protein
MIQNAARKARRRRAAGLLAAPSTPLDQAPDLKLAFQRAKPVASKTKSALPSVHEIAMAPIEMKPTEALIWREFEIAIGEDTRVADYDPEVLNQLRIRYALSRIAKRRHAAKARLVIPAGVPTANSLFCQKIG